MAVVVAAAASLTACNGGDDAETSSTTATTVSDSQATTQPVVETTAAPTTELTTTTPTSPPTTPPAPTTSPEEALKAQITADYLTAIDRYFELVNQPSLDGLADRAKLAAADGSEYYATVVANVERLVQLGDRIVPNEPDIRVATIEAIELEGQPPYLSAVVTLCGVSNAKQVTPAENSPVGEEILTAGTGVLTAIRSLETLQLTPQGWLPSASNPQALGIWEGYDQCPTG